MKKYVARIEIEAPSWVSDDDIASGLNKMIDAGLADAQDAFDDEDAEDPEAAEEARKMVSLRIQPPVVTAATLLVRYYVCGSAATIAAAVPVSGIDALVEVVRFRSQEELNAFEEGLDMADGWPEVSTFESEEAAKAYVQECCSQRS